MAEPKAVSRSRYDGPDLHSESSTISIILEVPQPPMGDGSGYIPPPIIEFFYRGRTLKFVYQGRE